MSQGAIVEGLTLALSLALALLLMWIFSSAWQPYIGNRWRLRLLTILSAIITGFSLSYGQSIISDIPRQTGLVTLSGPVMRVQENQTASNTFTFRLEDTRTDFQYSDSYPDYETVEETVNDDEASVTVWTTEDQIGQDDAFIWQIDDEAGVLVAFDAIADVRRQQGNSVIVAGLIYGVVTLLFMGYDAFITLVPRPEPPPPEDPYARFPQLYPK